MQITVKLYAALSEYLPENTHKNSTELDISPGETARTVLERCKVPERRAHLVLLNGIYLSPAQRESATFKEGDTLAVWPPVAGG